MSDDRCPEHDCDIAACFEEHILEDAVLESAELERMGEDPKFRELEEALRLTQRRKR